MLVLHPLNTSAAVQTSLIQGSTQKLTPDYTADQSLASGDESSEAAAGPGSDAGPTKEELQTQIKSQVKNICYDMIQQIAKEVHSRQGSSLDHGEADTSHMSASTTEMD